MKSFKLLLIVVGMFMDLGSSEAIAGCPYDPDCIDNPYGRYGSPYSPDSINNPYGAGNPYSNEEFYIVPSR